MADTFNLTAVFDKASYAPGETMTLTVSGNVTGSTSKPVSATVNITADDGSTSSLTAASSVSTTSDIGWKVTAVSDTDGRTWTIGSDNHSASAAA